MYDPIFAKSFSRNDRRRFGCFALLFSFIISLSICSTFKPSLHPLTLIGDAVSLHLSISAVESMLIDDAIIINNSAKQVSDSALLINETELPRLDQKNGEPSNPQSMLVVNETELPRLDQKNGEPSNPQDMLAMNETELPRLDQKNDELSSPENTLVMNETDPPRLDQKNDEPSNPQSMLVVNETELPGLDQKNGEPSNSQSMLAMNETELPRLDQKNDELSSPENTLVMNETELPRLDQKNDELSSPENTLVVNETELPRLDQKNGELSNPQSRLVVNETELPRLDQKNIELLNPRNELVINETETNHLQFDQNVQNLEPLNLQNKLITNESERNPPQIEQKQNVEPLNPPKMLMINEPERNPPQILQKLSSEPLCRVLKANADYCEIEGDVRVDPNSSTIFLIKPRSMISATNATSSWIIEPYPRKGTGYVKKWTVKIAADDDGAAPKCGEIHPQPALLFSIGGFSGNHFHDFADLLVPLFETSSRFKTEVQFLAADYKRWWPDKFRPLLNRLSRHVIIDIDSQKAAHCYKNLIAGVQYHSELVVDPSSGVGMHQFQQLLRRTYSLDRVKAIQYAKGDAAPRPRLMIVSRKRTRILMNEDQISRMARKLGFEVVSAEGGASSNLTKFAQLVNSCDVMMGVHGAGLTNMVFLPEKAVLIQIVPLGAIDAFARLDFGNPSAGMNLRYLEYKIETKESSLIERYPIDDPVIRDPISIHREGWLKLREVYLNNQNVTIDVRRFRATLTKALKLLRR